MTLRWIPAWCMIFVGPAALFGDGRLGTDLPPELDPSTGVIDGRVAVAFLAHEDLEGEAVTLDPSPYTVHLTPSSDLNQELVFPAGAWFQPPRGRYRVWVEGDGKISNGTVILSYSGGRSRERGLIGSDAVSPGGRVRLAPSVKATPETVLRLLHTDSHNRGEFPKRELSRRVRGDSLRNAVLMPEGEVIAGLFDENTGELVALTRPTAVQVRKIVDVVPKPPQAGSHLIVILDRPVPADSFDDYDVDVKVALGDSERAPDVLVRTAGRLYAVWYGLDGRQAEVRVSSPSVFLEPVTVPLRQGKIERLRSQLNPRLELDVEIVLPPELDLQPISVEARSLPTDDLVGTKASPPGTQSLTLEALPPAELEVALQIGPWEFRKRVDLSDGRNGSVLFVPEPIEVEGTVYRGEDPHPAVVRFRTGSAGSVIEVPTDSVGTYRTLLFRYVNLVMVTLDGRSGPPFVEMLDPPIRESGTRDFHLPANTYRVRVLNAATGEAVDEADVEIRNKGQGGLARSQGATTDSEGIAHLQPLEPGKVSVTVNAEDYYPSDPLVRPVSDADREVELTVLLEPVGETSRLHLALHDGTPAAGAELIAQAQLEVSQEIWAGHADSRGEVIVPKRVEGAWLLVRHPRSGFLIRQWGSFQEGELRNWVLRPPSEPLKILTVDTVGEPVPWARIAIWVDGIRLSGSALAWLTWTTGSSDRHGNWRAGTLPATEVQLLAWKIAASDLAHAGSLDALAVPVSYPRAQLVTVEAHGDR